LLNLNHQLDTINIPPSATYTLSGSENFTAKKIKWLNMYDMTSLRALLDGRGSLSSSGSVETSTHPLKSILSPSIFCLIWKALRNSKPLAKYSSFVLSDRGAVILGRVCDIQSKLNLIAVMCLRQSPDLTMAVTSLDQTCICLWVNLSSECSLFWRYFIFSGLMMMMSQLQEI